MHHDGSRPAAFITGDKRMPETPSRTTPATTVAPPANGARTPVRRRRGLRIGLLSFASLIALLGAVVAGGYAYVNHAASSIQRIPVKFTALDAASSAGGMTILLTSKANPSGSAGSTGTTNSTEANGLTMLLHINANQKAGGVVSIPPQTEVQVPGHGQLQLWNVLAIGGPSLLVKTVQSLTGVPINHYARVDFGHSAAVINALGGVTVTLPKTTKAFGHVFKTGVNQLNGVTAVDYVRQSSLSEQDRVLRQQNLMRAMLTKLAQQHLLTNPVTTVRVLNAITSALSVDSNFSNSQVEKLATKLGTLGAGSSTFVTAPVTTADGTVTLDGAVASQLWNAINHDSLTAFAKRYPSTVTPRTPQ
jgi:LCP family protein required for cell wall assembly